MFLFLPFCDVCHCLEKLDGDFNWLKIEQLSSTILLRSLFSCEKFEMQSSSRTYNSRFKGFVTVWRYNIKHLVL